MRYLLATLVLLSALALGCCPDNVIKPAAPVDDAPVVAPVEDDKPNS